MAFNWVTFKTRALTAIIFVAIMLTGLLWNQWSFLVLFSVVHFGCWIEYQRLVGLIDKDYSTISLLHTYGIMLLGWALMLWLTDNSFNLNHIFLNEVGRKFFLSFAAGLLIAEVLIRKNLHPKVLGYSVLGFLYISVSWALMLNLRSFVADGLPEDTGWLLPVISIVAIWINDTMAYIVGSLIGRTPLSPVSPKKTWEGTAGGAILAVVTVTLVGYYGWHLGIKPLLLISATAAIAGTAGDLLESKIKRMAGVKDSGQLMPGHGGFLDRFDSLLIATPLVWLVLKLFL
ncbi:MAG: phosphatidate cytidylyltransferase [Sediminibacterium sp.]